METDPTTADAATTTMLVTGGNTGIGLETVIGLAATGAHVVFTARDAARGEQALHDARERSGSTSIEMMLLDLASIASIAAFADEFRARHQRLDVLVANAGVATGNVRRTTVDGFEQMFGVNHLGHMELIRLLEPILLASAPARVVVVASGAYVAAPDGLCWGDLQHEREFHGTRVYAESKLANIWYARELARRLAGTGVTVNALNPGMVATELGHARPGDETATAAVDQPPRTAAEQALIDSLPTPVPPAIGARTSIKLATSPDLDGVTGTWWSAGRPGELQGVALDDAQAERLWTVSEALLEAAR